VVPSTSAAAMAISSFIFVIFKIINKRSKHWVKLVSKAKDRKYKRHETYKSDKKRCLTAFLDHFNKSLRIDSMPSINLRPLLGATSPFHYQKSRSSIKNKLPRCRVVLTTTAKSTQLAPFQITYTTNPREIDVAELANLLSRCAAYSPGNATDVAEAHLDSSYDSDTSSELELEKVEHLLRYQRRLRRALANSLVCIAAYAPEVSLPAHLHCALPPDLENNFFYNFKLNLWRFVPGFFPIPGPKVLVGFARAVGDAALVATVHDIAVLPEMRGKGLGKILVEKLTDQVRNIFFNWVCSNINSI
jgi:Acetyltransferase (GNAT) family